MDEGYIRLDSTRYSDYFLFYKFNFFEGYYHTHRTLGKKASNIQGLVQKLLVYYTIYLFLLKIITVTTTTTTSMMNMRRNDCLVLTVQATE